MKDEFEHRRDEISEELFAKLTLATDKYQSASDGTEKEGLAPHAQRRAACLYALGAIDEFLIELGAEPLQRKTILDLKSALLDAHYGRMNSLFDVEKPSGGQSKTLLGAQVVSETLAAVQFLINDGQPQSATYRQAADALAKYDLTPTGLKGASKDAIKDWYQNVCGARPSSITSVADTFARDRLEYLLNSIPQRFPEKSAREHAAWIFDTQLALTLPKKGKRSTGR
jgi:hypothetical protein